MNDLSILPPGDGDWLTRLKQRIRGARQQGLLAANEGQSPDSLIGQQSAAHFSHTHRKPGTLSRISATRKIGPTLPDQSLPMPDCRDWLARLKERIQRAANGWQSHDCPMGQQSADPMPWPSTITLRKNRLVAEYALSGIDKPIGVAEYELVRSLPKPLDTNLTIIEQIESELSRDLEGEDA